MNAARVSSLSNKIHYMDLTSKEIKLKLQKFQAYISQEPPTHELRQNQAAGNTWYIPISFLEMAFDELFFGLWGTRDFRYQVVGNEIVGTISLWYIHPVTGMEIVRTGAAATMIRCKKDTVPSLDTKIMNALEMDFPHLKADCVRNAAASLGRRFGRDLNRKHKADGYRPPIPTPVNESAMIEADSTDSKYSDILENLELINDVESLEAYQKQLRKNDLLNKDVQKLLTDHYNKIQK